MKNTTKKKRNCNPNLVRARHCYSFAEIAEVYHRHTRTVQTWRREGLQVIDDASKPYLVMGAEIRRFLRQRRQKSRRPLKAGEFFCSKCRCPRKSLPDKLSVEITNKRLGKTHKQAFIRGACEACGQSLLLFSSDRKVKGLLEKTDCFYRNIGRL